MAVIGTSCEEEEFLGFCRKWALASIFPAQHEKAHITKDLHICQRFGVKGKGWRGGEKKQEKDALLHFKSSNSKWGFAGINSWSSSSREDESWQLSIDGLFSGRHSDITRDRKGNGKNSGRHKEQSMDLMIGQLYLAVATMLGLDQIIWPLFFSHYLGLISIMSRLMHKNPYATFFWHMHALARA